MAAATLNPGTSYVHMLEQAKQDFIRRHSHVPEQQRQQLWIEAVSNNAFNLNPEPSLAHQIPRSMSNGTARMTQNPALEPNSMDRTISAPMVAIQQSMTRQSLDGNTTIDSRVPRRSFSNMPTWQLAEEHTSEYALYPGQASVRRQQPYQVINEMSTFNGSGGIHEYEPAEYVHCIGSSDSTLSPQSQDSNRLLVAPLTIDPQWGPSPFDSTPNTPPTALTPLTTSSSCSMSRQGSINPLFLDNDDNLMFRVHSDSSSVFAPFSNEDGSPISFPIDVQAKTISNLADNSFFPSITGPSSEFFLSHANVLPSGSSLGSSDDGADLVEDMRRCPSSSSDASADSADTRQLRREREIIAQAERKIAPKALQDETKSASSSVQMKRVLSADGSCKDVAQITKTPYVRRQHPKIECQYCSKLFRGTHELDRHIARLHANIRKAFICIDFSPDKKFLANCKHCRSNKVYGAYYNAAAHLRRTHFHPKKRGRKGKHDQKRGGIGGGDDPPMEWLKAHWIKEVEVSNLGSSDSPDTPTVQTAVPPKASTTTWTCHINLSINLRVKCLTSANMLCLTSS